MIVRVSALALLSACYQASPSEHPLVAYAEATYEAADVAIACGISGESPTLSIEQAECLSAIDLSAADAEHIRCVAEATRAISECLRESCDVEACRDIWAAEEGVCGQIEDETIGARYEGCVTDR